MTEELVKRDELVKRLEDMLTMLIIDNGFHPNSYHANPDVVALTFRVVQENIDRIKVPE